MIHGLAKVMFPSLASSGLRSAFSSAFGPANGNFRTLPEPLRAGSSLQAPDISYHASASRLHLGSHIAFRDFDCTPSLFPEPFLRPRSNWTP